MKKVLSYVVLPLVCVLFGAGVDAAQVNNVRDLDANRNGIYEQGEVDPCAEYQSGPCTCYCPVTRFRQKNYCETQCVSEPYTCEKKCCRMVDQQCTKKCYRKVPQYYEKSCCRYVPQCYTKTCCRMVKVPQYYEKTCTRQVPEYYNVKCCRYVTECYDAPYCKKVPEYYTVCETKYRTKQIKVPKCCYEPYTCMEMRCVNAPIDAVCNAGQGQQQNMQRPQQNMQRPVNNANQAAQPAQAYNSNSRNPRNDSVAFNNAQQFGTDQDLIQTVQSAIENKGILEGREYIDIASTNGVVTITGVVFTPAKKDQIASIVSGVSGVQNVNNQISVGTSSTK